MICRRFGLEDPALRRHCDSCVFCLFLGERFRRASCWHEIIVAAFGAAFSKLSLRLRKHMFNSELFETSSNELSLCGDFHYLSRRAS